MSDVLRALGWTVSTRGQLGLLSMIAAVTGVIAVAGVLLGGVLSPIPVQVASWTVWLIWLGVVFPRNRRRDLRSGRRLPYRQAFGRDILLGITWNFAQLTRPATAGALSSGSVVLGGVLIPLGCLLIGLGAVMILAGVRALGVARTIFVDEYVALPSVTQTGIFAHVRHPLFMAGTAVSVGMALIVGTPLALQLALVNVCALPAYVWLEDRRCSEALGEQYVRYRESVGGILPRRHAPIGRPAGPWRERPTAPGERARGRGRTVIRADVRCAIEDHLTSR